MRIFFGRDDGRPWKESILDYNLLSSLDGHRRSRSMRQNRTLGQG